MTTVASGAQAPGFSHILNEQTLPNENQHQADPNGIVTIELPQEQVPPPLIVPEAPLNEGHTPVQAPVIPAPHSEPAHVALPAEVASVAGPVAPETHAIQVQSITTPVAPIPSPHGAIDSLSSRPIQSGLESPVPVPAEATPAVAPPLPAPAASPASELAPQPAMPVPELVPTPVEFAAPVAAVAAPQPPQNAVAAQPVQAPFPVVPPAPEVNSHEIIPGKTAILTVRDLEGRLHRATHEDLARVAVELEDAFGRDT